MLLKSLTLSTVSPEICKLGIIFYLSAVVSNKVLLFPNYFGNTEQGALLKSPE